MRFHLKRTIAGGAAADPDPRVAPGSVPDLATKICPTDLRGSADAPRRILLAAEGTALNTISVEIWVLDDVAEDRGAGAVELPTQAEKDAQEFYLCTPAPLVVTVGSVIEFNAVMPAAGTVYFRVTTAPVADGVLKAAFA